MLCIFTDDESWAFETSDHENTWKWFLYYKAFRFVVRSWFVFANSNCDWLKLMTSLILPNRKYCLQKQMKIELQVEMPYWSWSRNSAAVLPNIFPRILGDLQWRFSEINGDRPKLRKNVIYWLVHFYTVQGKSSTKDAPNRKEYSADYDLCRISNLIIIYMSIYTHLLRVSRVKLSSY